jgi:hypothetical protein
MRSLIGRVRAALHQDDYWHGERRVSAAFDPRALDGYPNDLSAKTRAASGPVNEVGVPLCDFGAAGYRLHPVTACQVALGWHERWLTERDSAHLARFFAIADWLVEHQRPWAGGGAWPIDVAYRAYGGLRAPWVSALVQGQALSVLARAWRRGERTGRVRRAMEAAFAPFERDVAVGGVRAHDRDGVAYEEYPTARPSIVLNGMVSALWGLHDLALALGDGAVRRAFDDGVAALARRLERYDLGFWSRYDLFPSAVPNIASPYYHREHVAQLEALERLAPHPAWPRMRARWQKCEANPIHRAAALCGKAIYRIAHGPDLY